MSKLEATPHLQLLYRWYLNTESWSSERNSTSFQLNDVIHIQADVHTGSHIALRLSIDSYVAMWTPNTESTPWHILIDFSVGKLHEAPLSIPSYKVIQ